MSLASRSRLVAAVLILGAIAAPSAQAGLFSNGPDPQGAGQQEAQSFLRIYSHTNDNPAPVQAPASTTPDNGFNYGDAAVGAGIAGGIALLGAAGGLTVRKRSQLRRS